MRNISITNARVFNGDCILPSSTVTIKGGHIFSIGSNADADSLIVNAQNGILLPGLIDCHVHLHGPENLHQLAQHGVTTGLDMASFSPVLIAELHALAEKGGLTDIRTPGIPACAPGSNHSRIPIFPAKELVSDPEAAAEFVRRRVEEGVDYIKLIADEPGFDQETLNSLVVCLYPPVSMLILTKRSRMQPQDKAK